MKKILVYDNDQDTLEVMAILLDMYNYSVTTKAHCINIIQDATELQPDLIIIDLYMPGMDGECAVQLLKQTVATSSIPVLLFSACDKIEKIAGDSQFDGYIKKPFNVDDVLTTIEDTIRPRSNIN